MLTFFRAAAPPIVVARLRRLIAALAAVFLGRIRNGRRSASVIG